MKRNFAVEKILIHSIHIFVLLLMFIELYSRVPKKSEISSAALTVSMCARFVLIPIEIATEFPFLFIYVSWSRAKSFILLMKSAREKMWESNKPKYVRAKFKFYLFCTWCLIWDEHFIHQHNKKSSAYFFYHLTLHHCR